MFTKLSRTEGKGDVHLNANSVVAIFASQAKTVIRTAAGGENASFVVTDLTDNVITQLAAGGAKFITLTRRKDGGQMHFNLGQVVGIYQRADATIVRTTAGGEHAEFIVRETLAAVEGLLRAEGGAPASVKNPATSVLMPA